MSIELAVGVLSVALFIWWLLTPPAKIRKLGGKIPGPPSYPLVGNALTFSVTGPRAFRSFMEAKKKYGPAIRLWLGPQLHVFLTDPDDIQMILSSTDLITKSRVYKVLSDWIGSGLLVSTGDLWHRRRKAITPTFHFKVLDDFVPVFNDCADTLIEILKGKSGKESLDITPYVSNCALDAISKTAMGVEVQAQTKPKSTYVTSILQMTKILSTKINYPWLGVEPVYSLTGQKNEEKRHISILRGLPTKVLHEKKVESNSKTDKASVDADEFGIKRRRAFLELLLDISKEKNPAFQTDQDIMDEVTTFMFEGHDTTTSCLSFTIWLLGKHPDIQGNVYNEVLSVFENKRDITMEDIQQLKYLERVIKETLRMYPSVPIIGRQIEEDTVLPSGYAIPAGTEVEIGIMVLHRDPKYFPDPDVFNPDRFLSEMKHPYAYIPFSAGPRNCIGQKFAMVDIKTILAKIILNFEIKSESEIELDQEMILRAGNGVQVTLIRREKVF